MLEQEGRKEMCELPSERVSELTVDASKGKNLPLNHLYRRSLSRGDKRHLYSQVHSALRGTREVCFFL